MAIKNFELKVDVQKSALDVLVSSNLPCFIQMICGLGSLYNELYPIDEIKNSISFSLEVNVDFRFIYVMKAHLFHDLHNVYVVQAFITLKSKS